MRENKDDAVERILFSMLCNAHLRQGGRIGLMKFKWKKRTTSIELYAKYEDNKRLHSWGEPIHAITDIVTTVNRYKKSMDDVAFYPSGDGDLAESGATWRILKNYMSFLRIVLKEDQDEMGSILRRLDAVMKDAMYGEDLKKAAERN